MNNTPKISVIMPVHNAAEYLEQSIGSVLNQTLKDIELICVDDGSTDNSYEELKKYALQDNRVKVFHFDTSKSALGARKKGVLEATGKYVMFLDADDYYSVNACDAAYSKITEKDVDIVHFSAGVVNCGNISQERIDTLVKYMKPYAGALSGKKVFEACFAEDLYTYTPVNKIYKAELCKKAYELAENKRFLYAEDLYAYFIISYYAESYYGFNSEPLYFYCYGRGLSNNEIFSLKKFENLCSHAEVLKALKRFVDNNNVDITQINTIFDKYKKEWFEYCIYIWKNSLDSNYISEGMQLLCNYWGPEETIALIADKYWADRKILAKRIGKLIATPIEEKEIKTIAFYYYRYSVGGAEKVISLLMPMFMEMGYNVVLITDENPTDNDFELPKGVKRIIVEDSRKINFHNRINSWKNIVSENKIDLLLYNAWEYAIFFWDMLYLKSIGVSVVVQTHGVFSTGLAEFKKSYSTVPNTYRLADAVVALSNVDKLFFEAYNERVYYIPNPISKKLFEVEKVNYENKSIVWIGRASKEKNPLAAFEIMNRVIQSVPNTKVYMVGDFDNDQWKENARKYNIENNVICTGFVSEVNTFIEKASIHLMTSNFEGFPMALVEAKAHGMPTVMFNLPHLELGDNESGTISVDMFDYDNAAEEIVKLLSDSEYWNDISKKAADAADKLKNYNYMEAWEKVFKGEVSEKYGNTLVSRLIYTVDNHYELGITEREKYYVPKDLNGLIKYILKLRKTKGVVYIIKACLVQAKRIILKK